ncbi:MAG TPA: glycosyltransferase family 4 protein [Firmicutes bacterium]|nr:glycosyltransferase family 4 protein [Bacillota bacterium]
MRVCMVTKFPPIQGGIAAKSYWLARGLGETGTEVHVVTNAGCVEPEYRITGCEEHLKNLPNVHVHDLAKEVSWHVPFSKAYAERLLDLVLRTVEENQCQVVDSGFLMPYGLVAFLANRISGIPYVVRHGGSDLAKFLHHPEFSRLMNLAITNASAIVTDNDHADYLRGINQRVVVIPSYVPDHRYFKPTLRKRGARPVVLYLGKINYYWQNKRLLELLGEVLGRFPDVHLVFVAQGNGIDRFKRNIGEQLLRRIKFRPFVPPWEVPSLLSGVDYVMLARDEVVPSASNVEQEAVACGRELIALSVENAQESADSPGRAAQSYTYERWIQDNLAALKSCISGRDVLH